MAHQSSTSRVRKIRGVAIFVMLLALFTGVISSAPSAFVAQGANPFLPLWERVPDGEPRVFKDPATGEERLYVYGSHDSRLSGYCGPEHVVWSAPVSDPNNWRQEGTAFHVDSLNGAPYIDSDGVQKNLVVDVAPVPSFTDSLGAFHQGSTFKNQRVQLYAPDVVYHPENNKYYMYLFVDGMWHVNPSSTGNPPSRRHLMFVATSDSPAGPFTNPKFVTLAFDPAVLVDDVKNSDGKSRVYLYWTPEEKRSLMAAELDPNDMATILPGTTHYPLGETDKAPANTLPDWDAPFYMFEGSSIRKVGTKYLMAYCRGVRTTWNATSNISEIGWAYADAPFGPWTYGGVVVSNKGELIQNPYTGAADTPTYTGGNIHGGMAQVNGQWYQIYHRDSGSNGKRQAMAEPFNLTFDASGNPQLDQVELTSQGFEVAGLDPYKEQYASYASYILPATGATAPRFFSQLDNSTINFDPNAERDNWYPAQNLQNRSWLGYKYFNFGSGVSSDQLRLVLTLKESRNGVINVYAGDAKTKFADPEQPKTLIGSIELKGIDSSIHTVEGLVNPQGLIGKKGIYLEFLSSESGEIAQVNKLQFRKGTQETEQNANFLQSVIATYAAIETAKADYTPATFAVFAQALANARAVQAIGAISQTQLQSTLTQLAAATAGLTAVTNPSALNELIATAKGILANPSKYNAAKQPALADAVAAAQTVVADPNANAAQLHNAISTLAKAIAAVQAAPVKAAEPVTTGSVTVKGAAFKKNTKPKVSVSVKLSSGVAKGKVTIYVGSKAVKTVNVSKAVTSITLPAKYKKAISVKAQYKPAKANVNGTQKLSAAVKVKVK